MKFEFLYRLSILWVEYKIGLKYNDLYNRIDSSQINLRKCQ